VSIVLKSHALELPLLKITRAVKKTKETNLDDRETRTRYRVLLRFFQMEVDLVISNNLLKTREDQGSTLNLF
jgi:hypothetical protein